MDQYLEATTVHGFPYLHRRNSLVARIFWGFVIVAGFALAGILISDSFVDWGKHQSITTLESISSPIQEIQFPTVTVCPHEESPPDNWSFLEKFLESIDLSKANTNKVRHDFVDYILKKLLEKFEATYNKAPILPTWPIDDYLQADIFPHIATLICEKKFTYGDLRNAFIANFANCSFDNTLWKLPGYQEIYEDNSEWGSEWGYSPVECNECCKNIKDKTFFRGILNTGSLLLYEFHMEGITLGTLLSNFANLTYFETSEVKFSSFSLETPLSTDSMFIPKYCQKMTKTERFIHNYFKDLGSAIGLNNSLSLLDIPSMLGSAFKPHVSPLMTREAFLFSQCEMKTLGHGTRGYHPCFDADLNQAHWEEFLSGSGKHPCDEGSNKCCNFWTTHLQHRLLPIMKVMRMASGRGQSHFNTKDFMKPFLENPELLRYPLNNNITKELEAWDKTSFLPMCSYSNNTAVLGLDCKLFEPVVTDMGICYSFNAEPSMILLADSAFKDAFEETYKTELINDHVEYAKGPGNKFALNFVVDNSRFIRKKINIKPFKVILSSRKGYFNSLGIATEVRPGFLTIFNVQPLEVTATDALKEISEEARKCRFPDEISNGHAIFNSYGEDSCEFECRINKARAKCQCTPWNIPTQPSMTSLAICDLYGNYCFNMEMSDVLVMENCAKKCPSDCENVRFNVNTQEVPIDVDALCKGKRIKQTY